MQQWNCRNGDRAFVQFGVPLNSSSQNHESLVVLNDVPMNMNIENLTSMLSSYGAVRSLKAWVETTEDLPFVVEYHMSRMRNRRYLN